MSLVVACPKCAKSIRASRELAGKRGRCPHCQTVIQLPGAPAAPSVASARVAPQSAVATTAATAVPKAVPPATPRETLGASQAQRILSGFTGELPERRLAITYRLGACLVAVVMILLPLVYVALIGLVGYGVYYHAVHHAAILGAGHGRGTILLFLLYAGPLLIGLLLVLFMIKPLFARPAGFERRRSLTRDGEPLLYAFVERVCEAVGAPIPRRIDVDCQVNASAGFRRGVLSMMGDDLVLTIGVPLAAGLSLRQFAGVLAHEFGHFSQGAGMRLTYVIRSISWWFTRVVYERDQWDQTLIDASENTDWRIAIFLWITRFFVWITRRILWVLMMIGHLVGGFMLRQMEFDADRYEAQLAGSDVFESTARRLLVLNVAYQGALVDAQTFFQEGRLGDNLSKIMIANVAQIPGELHAKLTKSIDESRTGLFDTHPSDRDRIANAHREQARGIFHVDGPASALFSQFDTLSRSVTGDFYRTVLGPRFKPSDMHPTDTLLAKQDKEREANKSLARYFQGCFSPLRPLPLRGGPLAAPTSPKQCAAEVKAARARMLALRDSYEKAFEVYDAADTQVLEAEQASALLRAGVRIPPGAFSVPISTSREAGVMRERALGRQRRQNAELVDFENTASERLFGALSLLYLPQVAQRIDQARQKQERCAKFVVALRSLHTTVSSMVELRNEHASLAALLNSLEGNKDNEALFHTIGKKADSVYRQVMEFNQQFSSDPYPFDHAKGNMSIGAYVVDKLPADDDLGAVFDAGMATVETTQVLYLRLLGQLTALAEEVEAVLGLPRLPEPPPKPEPAETTGA